MSWSAEEVALAVTGATFFAIVVLSFVPRFVLSPASRVVFAMGAVVMGGLAPLLAMIGTVRYPPLVWLLPLVPCVILVVLIRDARRVSSSRHDVTVTLVTRADDDAPRRAAFFPPSDYVVSLGEGGDGSARDVAADPTATPQELADIAFSRPHLRALVAANPATPANVLEWLASHGDPVVNATIAARSTIRDRVSVARSQ